MINDERNLILARVQPRTEMLSRPSNSSNSEDYDLLDIWQIIRRRRKVLLASIAAVLAAGALYCLFAPRLYKAEAKLELLRQDAASGLSSPAAQSASDAASDALDFNLQLQTELNVLKSDTLALRVLHELSLENDKEFTPRSDKGEQGTPLEEAPHHKAYALKVFQNRLGVDPISGTRLISVSYLDANPKRSVQIVNQLLADFIEYNFQVRYNATSRAATFLSNELQGMKAQVEQLQANAVGLQQQSGIYGVDEVNNAVIAKLEQLNTQLTAAEANRVVKESVYNLAKTRSPEVLAGLVGTQNGVAGSSVANSPLQILRQQQSDAAAEYADLNARYGSEYPKVLQANERLNSLQASINRELERLLDQAKAEYDVAVKTEAAANQALDAQKVLAMRMNQKATLYTTAKHEADTSRDLYEQLLRRLKEADVLAGLRSSDMNILDSASVSDKPAQPKVLLYMSLALGGGIILGLAGAFIADATDVTIRDLYQIQNGFGSAILGLIPIQDNFSPRILTLAAKPTVSLNKGALQNRSRSNNWKYQTTAKVPMSAVAEAFRALRTATVFAMPGNQPKVLEITSATESEGKSFTTFNLAAAIVQSGKTVLVIDADMRKATLTQALGLGDLPGLNAALNSPQSMQYVKPYEALAGLDILPAGQCPAYPAEVLGSMQMARLLDEMKKKYDFILIDTPSVLPVTDAVALSVFVDAFLLVAKFGTSTRNGLNRALELLGQSQALCLGIVMNGLDGKSSEQYYYGNGKHRTNQIDLPQLPLASRVTAIIFLLLFAMLGLPKATRAQTEQSAGLGTATAHQAQVIGPGDSLDIRVFDAPELSQEVRVTADGQVKLMLLGDVGVGNLREDQAALLIEGELKKRKLIRSPSVSVTIKDFATQGVTIEGEVLKPGVYPIFATRTVVDIIAMAGGLGPDADTRITIQRHGTNLTDTVTLPQNNAKDVLSSEVLIYPGDRIVVPRAGIVYVIGAVIKPGQYLMHDNGNMTVVQSISEAQGMHRNASLDHSLLIRKNGTDVKRIPLKLKEMMKGTEQDVKLEAGDIVFVPESGVKNFGESTQSIVSSMAGGAMYGLK